MLPKQPPITANRRRAAWLAAPACALAVVAAGCGDGRPDRVPVAGRVLIDGQPLEHGNVRFHPKDQRPASAKLGSGGHFTLSTYEFGDGVVLGAHTVTVMGFENVDRRIRRWHAPKKFAGPDSSGLTFEVNEPIDDAEIQLSWEGGKPFDERIIGGGD